MENSLNDSGKRSEPSSELQRIRAGLQPGTLRMSESASWIETPEKSSESTHRQSCSPDVPEASISGPNAPLPGQVSRVAELLSGGASPSGSSKALTYDDGKAPLAWLPWAAVEAMSRVQAYGHKKYRDFNNYRKGMEVSRNLSCALRHIMEYMSGHDVDDESGEHPLAHAMCRIAFVLQNIHERRAIDDRFKWPTPEWPKE